MSQLPEDPVVLVNAIGTLAKFHNEHKILSLLEKAKCYFEYTGDDWGVAFYNIILEIPISLFAEFGEGIRQLEEKIGNYGSNVTAHYTVSQVRNARIVPDITTASEWRSGEKPIVAATSDVARIWSEGSFRLFISHSSNDKEIVAKLSKNLGKRRLHGFVAHEAIEASRIWQSEIEFALASCHAIIFLSSIDSNKSTWCQQEIGWGLGRGILVQPIGFGADPPAFLRPIQSLKIDVENLHELRDNLMKIFIEDDRTEPYMREPLVVSFSNSTSELTAEADLQLLETLKVLDADSLRRIENARKNNSKIAGKPQLEDRTAKLLKRHGFMPEEPVTVAIDEDEYDPFAD